MYKGEAPGGGAVAVKVMALSSETAEEVRKEIVMMRGCLCANIVTYLDAFVKPHEGLAKLWVLMEWCQLGSAHDLMARRDAPFLEAISAPLSLTLPLILSLTLTLTPTPTLSLSLARA